MKTTSTQRGFVYSFFHKPPAEANSKPTILFLHGFPSTHHDWQSQITFFSEKGYGIVAPDLLGYGGTDAPKDPSKYKILDIAQDVVDILDDLDIEKVIGVGHDWGSFVLSRLLNVHSHRCIGAAFLTVGYAPPQPDIEHENLREMIHKLAGYDVGGYMKFFAEEDAASLCEEHIDSFYSILFPEDPFIWKTDLAPPGKLREWLMADKEVPRPEFWTEERKDAHKSALLEKGLEGPTNWYKAHVSGLNKEDDAKIPHEAYTITIPTFFLGSLKDKVGIVDLMKSSTEKFCSDLKVSGALDVGHFIMLEDPGEVNDELDKFFDVVVSAR